MDRLLTDKDMLQPVWDMGVALEKEGRVPEQIDRFRAIAQAQDKKTLKAVGEHIDQSEPLIGECKLVAIRTIEALKRGEFPSA